MHADVAEIQPKRATRRRAAKIRLIGIQHLDARFRSAARARKLVKTFTAEIGSEITAAMTIAIERAATLVVLAEDARARRLAGDLTITLDDLVRCDRVAAAAVRSLGLPAATKRRAALELRPAPFETDGR